jgi:hypothetical protein
LLAACAGSTPPVADRPALPPLSPACKGAPLPEPTPGRDARVFALQNRAAAIEANRGVDNCQAFYSDVRREFSATP